MMISFWLAAAYQSREFASETIKVSIFLPLRPILVGGLLLESPDFDAKVGDLLLGGHSCFP